MSETVIKVEHLSKHYRLGQRGANYGTLRDAVSGIFRGTKKDEGSRDLWALDNVSFEVNRSEVLGVIGRNGAGKSTLLKVLSRITEPTKGRVEINGRVASLLEVGTGFHPELTGRENIFLNGAILGMTRKETESKFNEIVAFADLEKFIHTPVKFYSSGMYVRLAFAVAAHLEPEILLVDEVLAVGDIEFQKRCIGKIENVVDSGKTVLIVSHNMSTVKSLCTKALLLEEGKHKIFGDVDEVVNEYLNIGDMNSTVKELSEDDHDPKAGKKIRAKRVEIIDGVENKFKVHWQQPIRLRVDIEVKETVDEVCFGAAVRMMDGTFLIVVYNNDEGKDYWTFEPGEYTVDLEFENTLKPGVYMLAIGAHQRYASVKNLFHVDAVNLEVMDINREGKPYPAPNPAVISGVESDFSFTKN